jgi:hypothetical protein
LDQAAPRSNDRGHRCAWGQAFVLEIGFELGDVWRRRAAERLSGDELFQLRQAGLDSAAVQLLMSRKRAKLEDLNNRKHVRASHVVRRQCQISAGVLAVRRLLNQAWFERTTLRIERAIYWQELSPCAHAKMLADWGWFAPGMQKRFKSSADFWRIFAARQLGTDLLVRRLCEDHLR